MKRAVFLLTLLSVLNMAPMAVAQVRDPFDPLVVPGAPAGAVTDPEVDTVQAPPAAQVPSDRLADTGFDPAPYLVLAYGLLAAGGAALFLSRAAYPARKGRTSL
jgi:hypothetical protein